MASVLVVDDKPEMRWLLARVLTGEGFEVAEAGDSQSALDRVMVEAPAAIVLDLRMPGLDGIATLKKLREIVPSVPVIMLTAYGDIPTAVQAMRLGAYDYLTKPFHNQEICLTIRRALEREALLAEIQELKSRLGRGRFLRELMGQSPQIQMVIQKITQVASSTFTVLVQGETGTGKELAARAVHQQSPRREKPFIPLDCGAIPETLLESELFGHEKGAFTGADRKKLGHFQLADGGSLFLDEIANLPLSTQSKLLRVLQERQVRLLGGGRAFPVDVRIIAASNVALETEMRAGRFRQDLYYRLSEFTINLPPLRERREDILYLAKCFLAEAAMELKRPLRGISEEAAETLLRHSWPGNVRELKNVIRQGALLSTDLIGAEHLPALTRTEEAPPAADLRLEGGTLKEIRARVTAEAERQVLRKALAKTKGNKSQAAKLLGIDYKTLHCKLSRYGLRSREFQP